MFLPKKIQSPIFLISFYLLGCGYHPIMDAEEYQPALFADHQIDLASPEQVLEIYQIMKDTHEVFGQCGLSYWADSGTALGAERNQGFIGWDDDNDIAVLAQDVPQLLVLRPIFTQLGYFIEKVFFGYRTVKPGTTAQVDIFLMQKRNGNLYYNAGYWGMRLAENSPTLGPIFIKESEVYPIRQVQFGPIQVNVAHNSKPYLDALFKGWPDVAFTYGHLGQRKFKIDLNRYPEFKRPGPLDPTTLQTIDLTARIQDRVAKNLICPRVEDTRNSIPIRPFFDGV